MKKAANLIASQCLKIKVVERVLIVTDLKMLKIGKVLYQACRSINSNTILMIMEPTGGHGREPPKVVAEAMKASDVVIAPTYYSLSHTAARRDASRKGVRIASMPAVPEFSFVKGGLTADYRKVTALCKRMYRAIKSSDRIEVSAPNGTEVGMAVGKYRWDIDGGLYHKRGDFGNLPAGEVCTAPLEGSTDGKMIFDYFGSFGRGVELFVKGGFVKRVRNSRGLERLFRKLGKKARNISEIGIGCNPRAKIIGNVLEDEKVYGTVHVGLGNNLNWGGKVDVPFHVDGVITRPTLRANGKILIKEGKWKI